MSRPRPVTRGLNFTGLIGKRIGMKQGKGTKEARQICADGPTGSKSKLMFEDPFPNTSDVVRTVEAVPLVQVEYGRLDFECLNGLSYLPLTHLDLGRDEVERLVPVAFRHGASSLRARPAVPASLVSPAIVPRRARVVNAYDACHSPIRLTTEMCRARLLFAGDALSFAHEKRRLGVWYTPAAEPEPPDGSHEAPYTSMIPHSAPDCKGRAVFGCTTMAQAREERTVTQASHASSSRSSVEPPSSPRVEALCPAQAFGWGTSRYRSFLQVLLDGLVEHETRKGGAGHAPEPLPAA